MNAKVTPGITEQMIASFEISQFKARYWRAMDLRDWDAYGEFFTPDAVFDVSGEPAAFAKAGKPAPEGDFNLIWKGREEIVKVVAQSYIGVDSCHHGHVHEFELTSPTTAKVIWHFEDILVYADRKGYRGYGYYHDTYVKLDGRWWIETTRLDRLFILPINEG